MGTTCTVLAFRDRQAWLAHIGDSRAYLLRDRHLVQLSEDQTLVAKLVSDGTLTQDEPPTTARCTMSSCRRSVPRPTSSR